MIGKKINQLATELAPESTDLTIIGDPTTGVSKKITIAQLGAIFSGAVSFYTNLAAFPVTGDINVIYCAKDTQKLYLWSGSAYVEVFPSQALLDTYQLRSEKGNANGYASLDSLGKVPISQLPNSIMEYKGTWNAATNTPTLANGTGDTGDVYICNVAGTVNFGAGPITFAVGDYVIYSGTIWQRSSGAVGTVTSVAASITGNSVSISGSPIVTSGTLAFAFAGNATQYVRGDGQLSTLPTNGSGGGASVSYYLNGSINQGTIGGVTYYEMNKTPIIGAGTDFTTSSNGYIASFLTDANDPALLNIPAGNFNFETYFEASSGGGSPTFYIELYKYDGTNFTLIASNSTSPKLINDATNIEAYFSALAVPQTTLTLTDRLAIRIYVTTAGRTITLHTENNTLCQVITTFTTGLTALNGLTAQVQYLATGTSGTDFNIASASATHTFNLPTASATNRGALASADWTTFNNKQNALTLTTTGSSGDATLVGATLNIPNYGSALTGYVPYTGATGNVNLGTNDFLTRSVFIEGATNYQAGLLMKQYSVYNFVTGAYTQIAPSTATELNIVHNQANTTRRRYALSVAALQDGDTFQYLVPRASGTLALTSDLTGGTVTSVAALTIGTSGTDLSSTVANGTTTPVITLNVPTASATNRGALSSTDWTTFNNKQNALTNPITGISASGRVAYFNGDTSITGSSNFFWDATNNRLGIGLNNPQRTLEIHNATADSQLRISGAAPSVSLGEAITGAIYQAKFGLITANGQYVTGGVAGDFIMISQTGATIFATSSTEKMRVQASGNVSIGNTNDTFKLDVSGTGRFTGALTGTSATFTAAITPLVLRGTNVATMWTEYYYNTSTLSGYIGSGDGLLSGANASDFIVRSQADFVVATGNNRRMTIASTGAATFSSSVTATGYNVANTGGSIQTVDAGAYVSLFGATGSPANTLIFGTNNSPKMTILANGNVGIGTNNPTFRLDVNADSIRFGDGGSATLHMNVPNSSGVSGNINVGGSPRITILGTGNVGIGTTSPTGKLMLYQSSAGNVLQNIVSNQGGSTQVGINFSPSMTDGEVASNPAQASIYATDSNFGANIIFATKTTGAVGNSLAERMRIKSDGIINLSNVPSSSAGLSSGDVYKTVAGVLMIV